MNLLGSGMPALSALLAVALLFLLLLVFLYSRAMWVERYQARVALVRNPGGALAQSGGDGDPLGALAIIQNLGELVSRSGLLSKRTLEDFRNTLIVAGFRSRGALGLLIGGKLLLVTLVPAALWLLMRNTGYGSKMQLYAPLGMAMIGLMLPDLVVRSLRKRHLAALESGLADALDLLVICSEAGLGLEAGLERVGTEIRAVHPAVAEELTQTSQELRVNSDRRVPLTNMGKRTGVESLRRLGGTMIQSLQYGTPLSDALRVLAAELRQEALNRFEAKAGRLSVLLTIPMIVFLLPCVFLVVGGPAIVQVVQLFRH